MHKYVTTYPINMYNYNGPIRTFKKRKAEKKNDRKILYVMCDPGVFLPQKRLLSTVKI